MDSTLTSSSKRCVAVLCHKPSVEWLELLNKFTKYSPYMVIDDNSSDYSDYRQTYSNVVFVQINDTDCINAGYVHMSSSQTDTHSTVSSWEKAVYYFTRCKGDGSSSSSSSNDYSHVWFIQDNVYVAAEETLEAIDRNAEHINSDLLSSAQYSAISDIEAASVWQSQCSINFDIPYYNIGTVACIRCSKQLLHCMSIYIDEHKSCFPAQVFFPTVANKKNLSCSHPAELATVSTGDGTADWSSSIDKMVYGNVYYPLNDLQQHSTIRRGHQLEWLRDRGITIEIPGEIRKPAYVPPGTGRTITVVKIPCKQSEPYQELSFEVSQSASRDQLLTLLKPLFASPLQPSLDVDKLKHTAASQLMGSDGSSVVNLSTLDTLSKEGHVETFTLSHASYDNNYCSVSMYLDEIGMLKSLTINERACSFAALCGFKGVQLAGDVYVARIRAFPNKPVVNETFKVLDLDSDAPWMRDIERINYMHGISSNKVAMQSNTSDDSVVNEGEDKLMNYSWSESTSSVEVKWLMPASVKSVKELSIAVSSRSIKVTMKGGASTTLLLLAPLKGAIVLDDSTWIVSDDKTGNKYVEFSLCKSNDSVVWSTLLEK